MTAVSFGLIAAGVLLNTFAQLLLKAGANSIGHFEFALARAVDIGLKFLVNPYILGGMACYAVSLVVWLMALSRVEVSVAYPMLSIGYVVNALAAWYLFGEALTPMRVAGIAIIVLGVFVVARS